jgi:Protein of unknown function VcgC/VcgE (DUF2780)
MPQIEEFIQSAVGDLGVSEGAARTGVGGVLQSLQQGAEAGDFQQLLSSMPGAAALLSKAKGAAAGAAEPGGGALGGALGAVGSMLGGGGGSALGLLSLLTGSGISSDQLGPFVSKFIEFAKSSAGQALMGRILSKAPEVAKLLG